MYRFFEDPGHGWLEVTRAELERLGLLDKISGYSYQSIDGLFVYLEEDSDLMKFAKARGWEHDRHMLGCCGYSDLYSLIGGIEVVHHEDDRIRGLPPFRR